MNITAKHMGEMNEERVDNGMRQVAEKDGLFFRICKPKAKLCSMSPEYEPAVAANELRQLTWVHHLQSQVEVAQRHVWKWKQQRVVGFSGTKVWQFALRNGRV